MPMPKTTVYENGDSVPRQNEIRRSRKIARMESKTETGAMQKLPDGDFGLGVFRPDFAH